MERYRTTILMAAALIILGAAAIFLTNKNATSPSDTPTPVPLTYVWEEPNPVSAIEIVSGTSKVSLTKDAVLGTWAIVEPAKNPADLFTVSSVADSLQKLQAQFALTGTTDLTQYGLGGNAMSVTATFSDTQGTRHVFNIGGATPDGSGYYVKAQGADKVYVVTNTTIEPLRTWLVTPPVQPPTPTPVQITIVPTETATSTPAATGTQGAGQTPVSGVSPTSTLAPATAPAATSTP